MDGIVDDLIRAARRCDRASKAMSTGLVDDIASRLKEATNRVARSWSGSNIGVHATIYLDGFKPADPDEFFDREWGCEGGHLSQTQGNWIFTNYEDVKAEVLRLSQVDDVTPLADAARNAEAAFEESKEELLPILDAILSTTKDQAIETAREKLVEMRSHIDSGKIAHATLPSGMMMTRDSFALGGGLRAAHHVVFIAWVLEQVSYGNQAAEVAKIARHIASYIGHKFKMKGTSVAKTDGKIFIGHGGSPAWRELALFIKDRIGLDYEEFNTQSPAGKSNKERLIEMLEASCFAFLIMSAEDLDSEGKLHARENVIHEVGLFQGRYGFERAIIVLENGCEEFSNIIGVGQIRFDKGKIKGSFEEIRSVLEREKIIKK